MGRKTVLWARATGLLAARWGINTQRGSTGCEARVGQKPQSFKSGVRQEKAARARKEGRR